MAEDKKIQRTLQGQVTSDKMDKAAVVTVERQVKHPRYNKFVKRTTKFAIQDAENEAKVGDKVLIEQCAPVSKTISWRLIKVLEQATQV